MKRYVILVVMLVTAGAAVANPLPSSRSREKPNALGFYQHQPKSSLHNYAAAPLAADTTSTDDDASTSPSGPGRIAPVDKPSLSAPPVGPGRIAPVDKTKTQLPAVGPGRIEPVDKTKTDTPAGCMTNHIGGSDSVAWGCAVRTVPKQVPEPGTYALLAIGLLASWFARYARRSRGRSTEAASA